MWSFLVGRPRLTMDSSDDDNLGLLGTSTQDDFDPGILHLGDTEEGVNMATEGVDTGTEVTPGQGDKDMETESTSSVDIQEGPSTSSGTRAPGKSIFLKMFERVGSTGGRCLICSKVYKTKKGSTTTLMRHAKQAHAAHLEDYKEKTKKCSANTSGSLGQEDRQVP